MLEDVKGLFIHLNELLHNLKKHLPRTTLHWISALLLWGLFIYYAEGLIDNNKGAFFDKYRHNDDARIHVMPMHRYDGEGTLKDDPVANDMLAFSTLGTRIIYFLLTPALGILAVPKAILLIDYLIILLSVLITARSKRAGLSCGILLGFFFIHSDKVIRTIGNGLQRSFAFPALCLWMAGILSRNIYVRCAAIVLAAITYPTAMAVALGAEGIYMLKNGINLRSRTFWRHVGIYILLTLACLCLFNIDGATKPYGGELPTFEEAQTNPAFGPMGRTKKIPLMDPATEAVNSLTTVFRPEKNSAKCFYSLKETGPILVLALLILLTAARISPVPHASIALFISSIILYLLARIFAFRLLYIPHRYLSYGMCSASIMLAVSNLGLLWTRVRGHQKRAVLRNFTAAAVMILVVVLMGSSYRTNRSMRISKDANGPIWTFIEKLPDNSRIAAHPRDADGISFWTGKGATPGVEQLLPWLDESWERNRSLAENTLRCLYATDISEVIAFCAKENITHILLDSDHYRNDFKKRVNIFEPLTTFTHNLLVPLRLKDLVLANPPKDAIIFISGDDFIVDVSKLKED